MKPSLGGPLAATATLTTERSPETVLSQLSGQVHELDGPFRLTFKLSGGGIVSRVMETPSTDLPWFGAVEGETFRIVGMPDAAGITPYQPIVRGSVHRDEAGSRITLTLAPHPGQRSFSGTFLALGALLGLYSLFAIGREPATALLGLAFAVTFAVFPMVRARAGFTRDCRVSLERLAAQVDATSVELGDAAPAPA